MGSCASKEENLAAVAIGGSSPTSSSPTAGAAVATRKFVEHVDLSFGSSSEFPSHLLFYFDFVVDATCHLIPSVAFPDDDGGASVFSFKS